MAGGWTRDGAVQDQIDASIEDALKRLRAGGAGRQPRGAGSLTAAASLKVCEECDEDIPEARRAAVPGVRRCVSCQSGVDKRSTAFAGYNRRGSKDSQLR